GALWSGWLALLLAELGLFSPWLHLGLTLAVSTLLAATRRPAPEAPAARTPRWELAAHAAVLLVALLLVARPFETVLGVRDAGVYANTGFAIARTGALVQSDALLAQWGQEAQSADEAVAGPARQAISNYTIGQPRDRYIATRLRAAGFFVYEGELDAGRVVPQGLHLLPAWIALLTAIGGPYLGLFAPGLLGMLGVWSVGMLGRRLAGPWVGLLAMAFLALNGAQIWFGRYSTAETVAQFLIFAGLYFFAKMTADRPRLDDEHFAAGPSAIVYAALSGVAIGQVAMARLDFFLLGPVLAYLGYMWLTRRWDGRHTALALGLGAMLLHAALHIGFIARAYFFDTGHDRLQDYALISLLSLPFLTPALREEYLAGSALARPTRLVLEVAALAVALGALAALRRWPEPILRLERWLVRRRGPLLSLVAGGALLLAGYAYLVRPQILDADLLFNTRGGWSDPLTRDPDLVALDVRSGRMSIDEAHNMAGVALGAGPFWEATADPEATAALRERLRAERGPWAGPLSNQTLNWLRLQGYVGAPIRLPVRLWYNEYAEMSWLERLTVDPADLSSEPAPINDKYMIPLANLVRVGWYLSPLGVILGIVGYALWWRRGPGGGAWLFLTVAFVGTFFYVRQTYGTSDQHYIYILRRFVPITYPAFALCMAYALAALAGATKGQRPTTEETGPASPPSLVLRLSSLVMAALLLVFLAWTNRPIIAHSEYAGAIEQLGQVAARFVPGRDVLLMRGGAPIYAESRDVPDMVATPLRFAFGLDAFAVKSSQPGKYADDLAAAARRWRAQGREVYLLLSASGGSFALPGFALVPAGRFTLDVPEFEQLTDQKPRNVARLSLPFAIYRLAPSAAGSVAAAPSPVAPDDFAAQVVGLYRPEQRADGGAYAWTNGDATLRLPWPAGAAPAALQLDLAGGPRPAHLGQARVCVSALPETALWPNNAGAPVELGCLELGEKPASYTLRLDPARLPPAPGGSLLVRLDSLSWVPAAEDPRQTDRRPVGVQLGGVALTPAE
ncbi:MAG: hypothetical protein HGA45_12935, partial [Chloroflexales bacterium]|nr:hypothetical protein [Chloroflexales bacterium]